MPLPDLIENLERIEGLRFAVVDAAHFDDLQGELAAAALPFVPLYLDERDSNVRAAGPHLVPLKDRDAAMRVGAIAADKPAVVWWVWPDEGEAAQDNLARHLRGINMAEIPVDRYDAEPESGDDGGEAAALAAAEAEAEAHKHEHEGRDHDHPSFALPARYDLVLFRHADPNVIAMLLPLLDSEQVSRLFGRAAGIILDAPDQGGLRAFARPEGLPDMPNGWLRISPDQYAGLGSSYQGSMLKRLKRELLTTKPETESRFDQIDSAFRRALGYRIYQYVDLRDFVVSDLEHGPEFELKPGREDVKNLLQNVKRRAALRVLDAKDLIEFEG